MKAGIRRVAFFVPEFERPYAVSEDRERQHAFRARVKNDQETLSLAFEVAVPDTDEDKFRNAMKNGLVMTAVNALQSIKTHLDYMRDLRRWEEEHLFPDLRGKVWLLFPYITQNNGWDTGIAIANISCDPLGLTKPQMGQIRLHFYGGSAPEPQSSCVVAPGTVFTTLASTIAPGFTGYLIAECDFYPARGVGLICRIGGNDPAMYVAEIFHEQRPKKAYKADGV